MNTMKISVGIPWRYQETRQYAKEKVFSWYEKNLPEASIFFVDSDSKNVFNPAQARNNIVKISKNFDVVVINDADTIPELTAIKESIDQCLDTNLVHLPYTEYRTLGKTGTKEYLKGLELSECDFTSVKDAISGTLVLKPSVWWEHGGQDERFMGWGYEDSAWYMAHCTLMKNEPIRHEGKVYAMYHEPSKKEGDQYTLNAERCLLYINAQESYDEMHKLVFGDSDE
jgi:hypothetical protein